MNRFAYGNQEGYGFLDKSMANAQALTKQIEAIEKALGGAEKVVESMNKKQQQAYTEAKTNAKLLGDTLKNIRDSGVLSQEELNSLIKDNEKVTRDSVKALQTLMNSTGDLSDKLHKNNRDLIEQTNLAIEKSNEILSKSKQEYSELERQINKTQDKLTKGIGDTLTKAGNKLASLANMFNLQSIANNTAESNARSKLAIQREVSSQLGLGSNTQFESFKNSLNDSLKSINSDMGSLFNADDLKTYMSNLSEFGITSIDVAKQQLKATIMGNKYLGVSTETQQQVFKYMRRTNNNDAMNEHNRMVVALLNSQLGVSKQQLDVLSQKSYTDAEALAALGLGEEGQKRYIQESTASKAVLESINKGWR